MSASLKSTALTATAQAFLARYEGLRGRLPGDLTARDQAAARLRDGGLPGPREEAWRFTPLRPLSEVAFVEALTPVGDCAELLARLPQIDAPRLVFVDGRYRPDLSTPLENVAIRVGGPAGQTVLAGEKMVDLNTMLGEDGVEISVSAGVDAGTLVLASLATEREGRIAAFHPRHAVSLGAGAKLALIDVALGEGVYLNNAVLAINLDAQAHLTHLRMQIESPRAFSFATVAAELDAGAEYDSFTLTIGARLSRNEVHANLNGPDAIAHLNAARMLRGQQHGDFTSVVRHVSPNCASRQTVKTVLDNAARGVFQGKIEVARGAQKTDGFQMNQALLLSRDAEMNSKPQLEIYADDVKCSHGATVGEIDAEQLFYLRSRGVPHEEARAMLIRAFLAEAIDGIGHEQGRAAMETAMQAWWGGEKA
jgi:Fe-S cluster assembly protein SufD